MKNFLLRHVLRWRYLFIILLILHLLPIWYFPFIPTHDGPTHAMNAKLLREYRDHANYRTRQLYQINARPFPNWTAHGTMTALMHIMPPRVAEKIILSFCVGLLPLSILYLLRAIDPENIVFSLFGFILSYSFLLNMGFYGFCLGVSLCLFALGYWWRRRETIRWQHVIILQLLLVITYFTHITACLMLLIALGVAEIIIIIQRVLETSSQQPPEDKLDIDMQREITKKAGWTVLRLAAYALVPCVLGLMYYLSSPAGPTPESGDALSTGLDYRGFEWLRDYISQMRILFSYREQYEGAARFVTWSLIIAFLLTVGGRIGRKQRFDKRDVFLVLAAVCAILFFYLPGRIGSAAFINERMVYYLLIFLPLWFTRFRKPEQSAFAVALVAISLFQLGTVCQVYRLKTPQLIRMAAAIDKIEPHSTIQVDVTNYWPAHLTKGRMPHADPFIRFPNYYALGKDVVSLQNYESNEPYFPMQVRKIDLPKPDYGLMWVDPDLDDDDEGKGFPGYELIHSSPRIRLFRKEIKEPDLTPWDRTADGHLIIKLAMQAAETPTLEGYQSVTPDKEYESGGFGWVIGPSSADQLPVTIKEDATYIGSSTDAVFRIDMPDGAYRVTCRFPSFEKAQYQVNVIANDNHVIKRLIIQPAAEDIERSYDIEVNNGHITLVIYTTWSQGRHPTKLPSWHLSALTIEQLKYPAN